MKISPVSSVFPLDVDLGDLAEFTFVKVFVYLLLIALMRRLLRYILFLLSLFQYPYVCS